MSEPEPTTATMFQVDFIDITTLLVSKRTGPWLVIDGPRFGLGGGGLRLLSWWVMNEAAGQH